MDITEWLHRLDLAQYADAFVDNAIDWEVLPSLQVDDLKEVGVLAVGHRRKLLNAIAALPQSDATPHSPPPEAAPTLTVRQSAERRQLTVMFCDLVGSTALSTQVDPEDLRELINDYHAACAECVGRLGGYVAKYMGDGVLAYFGYPQAHEDDPVRAIHAGLAIIEQVA